MRRSPLRVPISVIVTFRFDVVSRASGAFFLLLVDQALWRALLVCTDAGADKLGRILVALALRPSPERIVRVVVLPLLGSVAAVSRGFGVEAAR